MANKRRSREELKAVDALLRRLRDFIRLKYMTAAEVERQIGVRDATIYDWLLGRTRPAEPQRVADFLDSVPREKGSGIAAAGYDYREYKNWRGIPKPRRCPFCKQAKGDIRRSRGGFLGVCPNCDATGPKRESYDEAIFPFRERTPDRSRGERQRAGQWPVRGNLCSRKSSSSASDNAGDRHL